MGRLQEEQEKEVISSFINSFEEDLILIERTIEDKPDRIVEYQGKKVGIEITDLYREFKGKPVSQLDSFRRDLAVEILEYYTSHYLSKTHIITVDFSNSSLINKKNKDTVLLKIKKCIDQIVSTGNNNLYESNDLMKYVDDDFTFLPSEVIHLSFSELPDGIESWVNCCGGGFLPNLSQESKFLYDSVLKKEKLIEGYENCEQYWLLFNEKYSLQIGGFKELDVKVRESKYDRIYILRALGSGADKLKRIK